MVRLFKYIVGSALYLMLVVLLAVFTYLALEFFVGCGVQKNDSVRVVINRWNASTSPDFITTKGIEVYTNGVPITMYEVERLGDCFLIACQQLAPVGVEALGTWPTCRAMVENAWRGSKLEWVEVEGSETGLFVGEQRVTGFAQGRSVHVAWRPGQAFFQTSLFHEWAHSTLGAKDGSTPAIWRAVDRAKLLCK